MEEGKTEPITGTPEVESLVRSTGVQERIDRVRKKPQSTPEERDAKKLGAEKLRMELLIGNALLAQELIFQLKTNPDITADELKQLASDSKRIVHPDSVERFIDSLTEVRDNLNYLMEEYRKAGYSEEELPKKVFQFFSIFQSAPQGNIKVEFCPLAIRIFCEDKSDFDNLFRYRSRGYLGFYRLSSYPIIVVLMNKKGKQKLEEIVSHEERHSETSFLKSSLDFEKAEVVWGNSDKYSEVNRAVCQLQALWEDRNNRENMIKSEWWQILLNFMYQNIKDEFLAYASRKEQLPDLKAKLLKYNYLGVFNINKGLKKKLEETYHQRVEKSVKTALVIWQEFRNRQEGDLAFWVLAQIPFEKWDEDLIEPLKQVLRTKL